MVDNKTVGNHHLLIFHPCFLPSHRQIASLQPYLIMSSANTFKMDYFKLSSIGQKRFFKVFILYCNEVIVLNSVISQISHFYFLYKKMYRIFKNIMEQKCFKKKKTDSIIIRQIIYQWYKSMPSGSD